MLIQSRAGRYPLALTAALTLLGILAARRRPGADAARHGRERVEQRGVRRQLFRQRRKHSVLNTDANLHVSLRSLVFIPNARPARSICWSRTPRAARSCVMPTRPEPRRWYGVRGWEPVPRIRMVSRSMAPAICSSSSSGVGQTKPAQLWVFPADPLLPRARDSSRRAWSTLPSAAGRSQALEETADRAHHQQRLGRGRSVAAREQPRDRCWCIRPPACRAC